MHFQQNQKLKVLQRKLIKMRFPKKQSKRNKLRKNRIDLINFKSNCFGGVAYTLILIKLRYFSRLVSQISMLIIFTWKFILKSELRILVKTELNYGIKSYVSLLLAPLTYTFKDSKICKNTSPVNAALSLTSLRTH